MTPSTQTLVEKLRQQLKSKTSPSWYELLHVYLLSTDFTTLVETLVEQSTQSYLPERFTPPLKVLFKPFQLCPPDKVKVVIIVPAPWNILNQADGLALSSKSNKEEGVIAPAELGSLLEAVQHEFGYTQRGDFNLERWAKQGVLLLNRSLTIGIDKGVLSQKRHTILWEGFFNYVLESLRTQHPHAPIIYYKCPDLVDDDPSYDYAFGCKESISFAYCLKQANEELESQGQTSIIW